MFKGFCEIFNIWQHFRAGLCRAQATSTTHFNYGEKRKRQRRLAL